MLSGKRFQLRKPTIAIETTDSGRGAVMVDSGDVVKVISGPRPGDQMLEVLWNGRVVVMFAIDVQSRGEEVPD